MVASQVSNFSNLSINSATQGSSNDDDDSTRQEKSPPTVNESLNDDETVESTKPTDVDDYDIKYSDNGNTENEDYDGENISANGLFDVNDMQCVIEEPVADTNIADDMQCVIEEPVADTNIVDDKIKQFDSTNSLPTSDISDDNPFDEIRRIATENVTLRRKNRVAKYISDLDLGLFEDDSSQDVAKLLENVENASNTAEALETGNDENSKFRIGQQLDVSDDTLETIE